MPKFSFSVFFLSSSLKFPPPHFYSLVHAPDHTTHGDLHHARLLPRLVLHGGVAVGAGRAAAPPHPVHHLQINEYCIAITGRAAAPQHPVHNLHMNE